MAIGLQQGPFDQKNLINMRDIFQVDAFLLDRQYNYALL